MPIRLKVLSIAFALLIIFGIVITYSTIQQHRLAREIDAVVQYNLPIRAALSDFDVRSDEYELIILRLARRSDVPAAEIESEIVRARQDAENMREEVNRITSLLEQATADQRLPELSRRTFSELKSAFPFIARQLDEFIQTGEQVMDAIARGRPDEVHKRSLKFRETEQAFGPDTAAMREKLAASSETRFHEQVDKLKTLELINYMLFALAVCLGIGVGSVVSQNIVGTLRQLVEASKKVQAGERSIAVPVNTNDELGQLATAFNLMIAEIRAKERIQNAFGMFVDPRLVADMLSESGTCRARRPPGRDRVLLGHRRVHIDQ